MAQAASFDKRKRSDYRDVGEQLNSPVPVDERCVQPHRSSIAAKARGIFFCRPGNAPDLAKRDALRRNLMSRRFLHLHKDQAVFIFQHEIDFAGFSAPARGQASRAQSFVETTDDLFRGETGMVGRCPGHRFLSIFRACW